MRVVSKKGHARLLRRPIQHIYPLGNQSDLPAAVSRLPSESDYDEQGSDGEDNALPETRSRPVRKASALIGFSAVYLKTSVERSLFNRGSVLDSDSFMRK